ncbi:hypothetical protein [Rhizobium mayense]|uniref:DUF4239 domain-containing protein n=1 Tax=Rhizobium mayense TaxID=1312184 RepID=A0ABT7K542_9HYPH|nr:hypothetical protein [Rhizobium mayense]MDL2402533.1 hypothetical protein [Rhizobium mayense]
MHYNLRRRNGHAVQELKDGERRINDASYQIGAITCLFGLFGVAVAFLAAYNLPASSNTTFIQFFGLYLLVAAAAAAAGSVAGFIFGIPRTLDPAARAAVAGAAADGSVADKTNAMLAANTNLERISDWLTTLLIGATLVQIGTIIRSVKGFAEYLWTDKGQIYGPVILLLVYFFALAFLGIYLITRLYLTAALTQTLGMLAGGSGLTSAQSLSAILANSVQVKDPKELQFLVSAIDRWQLTESDREDPGLNALIARILYNHLMSGSPDNANLRTEQLRAALSRAIREPGARESLKSFFTAEKAARGDQTLPGDLVNMFFKS